MRHRPGPTSPALLVALVVLICPVAAPAKVTCQHRGQPGAEGGLAGLPDEPVAGETYTVTISTGRPPARREGPGVVLLEHGHRMPPKVALLDCSGRGDRFELGESEESAVTPTGALGEYTADVRFPAAGRWAMSVYGLRPAFRDLGMHRVAAAAEAGAGADGPEPLPWAPAAGGVVLLGLAIGGAVARRRSRRAARIG